MSEKAVVWRDYQEVQAADFNNQQLWQTESVDHVVGDAVSTGKAYTGFGVTKSGTTTISVAVGRLYSSGLVYANEEITAIDLFNSLPVVAQKFVAVVGYGQEINEDTQPRDFLIDASSGQTQPQSVSMRTTRFANISTVVGTESTNPQYPTIGATLTLIAYVRLDTSGIVSVTQSASNYLPNLHVVSGRLSSLEVWRNILSGQVETLRTDLANLASQLLNYASLDDFQRLANEVTELWTKLHHHLETSWVWYGTDEFLNEDLSNTAGNVDGAYSALVNEGLRFGGTGGDTTVAMSLYDPNDPFALTSSGFLLPRPSGARVRHDASFPEYDWVEDRILQYVYHGTIAARRLHKARWRHSCGHRYVVTPSNATWWYASNLSPTHHILQFSTESWTTDHWWDISTHFESNPDWPRHYWDRWDHYWRDYTDQHYWAKAYTNHSHSGQHIVQTYLNSQDGWLTGITLFLHHSTGYPLTIIIAETDEDGNPDHTNRTLVRAEYTAENVEDGISAPLVGGDILVPMSNYMTSSGIDPRPTQWAGSDWGPGEWIWVSQGSTVDEGLDPITVWRLFQRVPSHVHGCRLAIPPTFLTAGKRYGIHLISTSDYRFSVCTHHDAFQVIQGHYWYSHSDGKLLLHNGTITPKFLRFQLHFATWGRWGENPLNGGMLRYAIQLATLEKSGGISGVEVLAESVIPAPCSLTYECFLGGVWQPFRADPASPNFATAGYPAAVQFRVVMSGTTDIMPGVSLNPSEVTLTGPQLTAFHHISDQLSFGSATTSVKIRCKVVDFVEANHNLVCTLNHGADVTETADVGPIDVIINDHTIERTWTFTGLSSITAAYIILDGAITSGTTGFVVANRIAYAIA